MENNTNEQLQVRLRRSVRVSAIAVAISADSVVTAVNSSNMRTVDMLTVLAFGIAIGALLVNLSIMYRVKKMSNIK